MTKRILLAGLLGGVALFAWGALSHTVLPLGEVGIQFLPQEQVVMDALKASTPQAGFYFFPRLDASNNLPPEKAGGPHGLVIYHPTGASMMMTGQLINEFILNVVQALIAAFLLSLATGVTGYASRVGVVVLLGILTSAATNVEYWNWYGFPANYTVANIVGDTIGFLVVGLIAAAVLKPPAAQPTLSVARAA
jgi:hypothetical protein